MTVRPKSACPHCGGRMVPLLRHPAWADALDDRDLFAIAKSSYYCTACNETVLIWDPPAIAESPS